jgi:predicted small secreted protein
MKTTHVILSLLLCCSFVALTGCANTANGIHADWKQDSQSVANSTGN